MLALRMSSPPEPCLALSFSVLIRLPSAAHSDSVSFDTLVAIAQRKSVPDKLISSQVNKGNRPANFFNSPESGLFRKRSGVLACLFARNAQR
jgi:hypothetical protein